MELEDGEIGPSPTLEEPPPTPPPLPMPPSPDKTGETAAAAAPAVIVDWRTVRKSVTAQQVRLLFERSRRHFVDATSHCSEPGFVELARARFKELSGAAPALCIPVHFLRCCHLEHFSKRSVDYKAVLESHRRDAERQRKRKLPPPPPPPSFRIPRKPRSSGAGQRVAAVASEELDRLLKSGAGGRPKLVVTPLAELRGGALGQGFGTEERKKECPVCLARFSSEGWYRLGSCGHEYHLQCLMLHALCSCSCLVCRVEIPVEFYRAVGHEEHRPSSSA